MQDILKKSQTLVEKTKLQANIASKTVKMDSLFEELGKAVYEMNCECVAKDETAASIIVEIQATELEISALKDQIQALSNKAKCESCGEYFDADMAFCGHCGAKKVVREMPLEDEEEVVEENKEETTEE